MIVDKGPACLTSFVIKDDRNGQPINYLDFNGKSHKDIVIETTVWVDKSFKLAATTHHFTRFYLTLYSTDIYSDIPLDMAYQIPQFSNNSNDIPYPGVYIQYHIELDPKELDKTNFFKLKFKVKVDAKSSIPVHDRINPRKLINPEIKSYYIRLSHAHFNSEEQSESQFYTFNDLLDENKIFDTVIPIKVNSNGD